MRLIKSKARSERRLMNAIQWNQAFQVLALKAGMTEANLCIAKLKRMWSVALELERVSGANPARTRVSHLGVIVDCLGVSTDLYDKTFPTTIMLVYERDSALPEQTVLELRTPKGFFSPVQSFKGTYAQLVWKGGIHE